MSEDAEAYTTSDIGVLYEGYVAALLMSAGYTVQSTPRTGDLGADLLAYGSADDPRPYLCVECKYRSESGQSSRLDPTVIRSVFTAAHLYEAKHAVLVTNADLTREARDIATQVGVWVIDARSDSWSYGAPIFPRREEMDPDAVDSAVLGRAWQTFVDALRRPQDLVEAPWLWLIAERQQTRAVSAAVLHLAPSGVRVLSSVDVELLSDLGSELSALQDGQVLLIENAERLPAAHWPVLMEALESFQLRRRRLARFGCVLVITAPMQLPPTRVAEVLRMSGTELLRFEGEVLAAERVALASVEPLYAAKDSLHLSVDAIHADMMDGRRVCECHVAADWSENEQTNWLGRVVRPSRAGRDHWQVIVDTATQARLHLRALS